MSQTQSVDGATSQFGRALILLREMVLRGEFDPGERLLTVPLAKRIGVSRTPIRLALERLAQEGILESRSGSSFTVCQFVVDDIWDAVEARGALEGAAARLAAERLDDAGALDPLWRLNDQLNELASSGLASNAELPGHGDAVARYAEINEAFHSGVVVLAKSKMLRWSLDRVQTIPFVRPGAGVISPASPEIVMLSIDHHNCILESIRDHEGARAESLTREHARLVRRNLERILKRASESDVLPRLPLVSMS